ncbi:unnamed protein product [Euphydryas editha]|uniref:Uncharacterized protein n=1 Tax=Euphydryas editha TaxID=104508 RepID=A0AAU9TN78_EUPED|nr:unnamed protein product [Euphydryas editha]
MSSGSSLVSNSSVSMTPLQKSSSSSSKYQSASSQLETSGMRDKEMKKEKELLQKLEKNVKDTSKTLHEYVAIPNRKKTKLKSDSKCVSTGYLIRHLRDVHGLREEGITAKKTIQDFFTTSRPRPSTSNQSISSASSANDKWFLARDLALWFCRSL